MPTYTDPAHWASLVKMSLSRFFVLHALHRHPMHGYELSRVIADITHGCCAPSEGALYPMLKELEQTGCLSSHAEIVGGRERKCYTLTPDGERAYKEAAQAWSSAAHLILVATGHTR
ncbi:MAG: PadR family transcriptional regulator [Mycobacterium leprae]